MIDHALGNFGGRSQKLAKDVLGIYCSDFDLELAARVAKRGFRPVPEFDEPASRFVVNGPIEPSPLPTGFAVLSLLEHNDFAEINRVL